jgi:hypothetical protein
MSRSPDQPIPTGRIAMTELIKTRNVFLAVLFLGLFAMVARNATDPDIWWHLKTGQYITEHKSIPHTDPFSYTRAGQPWIAHEWLTEHLLYQIQRIAGYGGLIVVFAAIVGAAFFLLYLRCGAAPYIAGVATLFAAWATAPLWGVRPQMLSLLLTSLWLLLLERSENDSKLLWWTLPLTLLWVNLHGGFAAGLALLTLFLAGEWMERALGWSSPRSGRHLKTAALILVFDLLLVPLNPSGLRMFWYPIQTLRSAAMQNYIAEWASPNFHHAEYWPFLVVVLGTFAALSWSGNRVRPRNLLLLVVTLYAGLCSIRMIPLFVLIAIPLIAKRLREWPPRTLDTRRHLALRMLLNGVIVLAMAAFTGIHLTQVIRRQPQAEAQHFPVPAVAFLATHAVPAPIFNHYDWGGYLIWKLYPSIPVFIDGRADLYEKQLLDQFADTYRFQGDWRRTLRQWDIGTIVVPMDSALATGVRSDRAWTVAYQDAQAMVLTRAGRSPDTNDVSISPAASK